MDYQAFPTWYDLAPSPSPPSPVSKFSCVSPVQLTDGRGRRGEGSSQITRRRKNDLDLDNQLAGGDDIRGNTWRNLKNHQPQFKYFRRFIYFFSLVSGSYLPVPLLGSLEHKGMLGKLYSRLANKK
jgi:hypothetical protein